MLEKTTFVTACLKPQGATFEEQMWKRTAITGLTDCILGQTINIISTFFQSYPHNRFTAFYSLRYNHFKPVFTVPFVTAGIVWIIQCKSHSLEMETRAREGTTFSQSPVMGDGGGQKLWTGSSKL